MLSGSVEGVNAAAAPVLPVAGRRQTHAPFVHLDTAAGQQVETLFDQGWDADVPVAGCRRQTVPGIQPTVEVSKASVLQQRHASDLLTELCRAEDRFLVSRPMA